ncbi:GGDEF domain-containing protein [Paraglaciecola sp. Hal342]
MLSEHQANGGVLCLLYIDLDNFKHINDSYGHKAGDEVLQIIAKIIRKQMRDQDAVGRLGEMNLWDWRDLRTSLYQWRLRRE